MTTTPTHPYAAAPDPAPVPASPSPLAPSGPEVTHQGGGPSASLLAARTSADGLPFHRLARRTTPLRWWRPILVVLTSVVFYLALLMAVMVVLIILALAVPGWEPTLEGTLELGSMNDPAVMGGMLLLIAVMLPTTLLAVAIAGRRRAGTLLSVTGRLRWPLIGRAALVTFGVFAVFQVIALIVDPSAVVRPVDLARLLPALVLVVVITPFQAVAEEVVFRGLLMQTIGAWLRHPAWAILLPVPLFVVGHDYNAIGLVDIAVFAVVAGYLTWRTGGLEAAIGMHVVNNVAGLLLGLLTGADLDATDIAPLTSALGVAYTLITAALILVWHRRSERRAQTVAKTLSLR